MKENLISVKDIAKIHDKRSSSVHRLVKKLKFNVVKERTESSRGQRSSHITENDYEILKLHLDETRISTSSITSQTTPGSYGEFYLVLLEPILDSGRFKVGYTKNIDERMRSHLTAAPLAKVMKTWPCKLVWERTAIECISQGCEQLYTEVFRAENIDEVVERAEQFFSLMPQLTNNDT